MPDQSGPRWGIEAAGDAGPQPHGHPDRENGRHLDARDGASERRKVAFRGEIEAQVGLYSRIEHGILGRGGDKAAICVREGIARNSKTLVGGLPGESVGLGFGTNPPQ